MGGLPVNKKIAPYFSEYFARIRLKKLGYVSKLEDLDAYKANMFLSIDAAVEEQIDRKQKAKMKSNSRKR